MNVLQGDIYYIIIFQDYNNALLAFTDSLGGDDNWREMEPSYNGSIKVELNGTKTPEWNIMKSETPTGALKNKQQFSEADGCGFTK